MVAVACTDPQSFNQRVDSLGGAPSPHAVLVWNFRDPIHPELVLESPYEVFCFQSNPLQPEVITGGLYNGQIIMWDTASQEVTFLYTPLQLGAVLYGFPCLLTLDLQFPFHPCDHTPTRKCHIHTIVDISYVRAQTRIIHSNDKTANKTENACRM